MTHRALLVSVVSAGMLLGCDQGIVPVAFDRRRQSDSQQAAESAQRERELAQNSLEGERQSLRLSLSAAAEVVSNEVERLEQTERKLSMDRTVLSERIKTVAGRGGSSDERDRGKILFALLDDDVVNELALRHLGHDFRLERLELGESLKAAKSVRQQRDAALAANKSTYEAQVQSAKEESDLVKASANRSVENLAAEIAVLEDRRTRLNRKLQLVSVTERSRLMRELNNVDSQLQSLRRSYDSMRANRNVMEDRSRASRDVERAMVVAAQRKADKDARVNRQYNAQKDEQTLVSDCEASTVRVLEKAMKDQLEKVGESLTQGRRAQIRVKTAQSGVGGLGSEALKRVRAETESFLEGKFSAN